jgi:hypothetical protein
MDALENPCGARAAIASRPDQKTTECKPTMRDKFDNHIDAGMQTVY